MLECKRALTGLGPSMALKSQGKYINCADFDETANNSKTLYDKSLVWIVNRTS